MTAVLAARCLEAGCDFVSSGENTPPKRIFLDMVEHFNATEHDLILAREETS